jgi:transposase-like protein
MKRRKWDAPTKAMMVIEGLQGRPVAELCTEHQISQSLYSSGATSFSRRQPRP